MRRKEPGSQPEGTGLSKPGRHPEGTGLREQGSQPCDYCPLGSCSPGILAVAWWCQRGRQRGRCGASCLRGPAPGPQHPLLPRRCRWSGQSSAGRQPAAGSAPGLLPAGAAGSGVQKGEGGGLWCRDTQRRRVGRTTRTNPANLFCLLLRLVFSEELSLWVGDLATRKHTGEDHTHTLAIGSPKTKTALCPAQERPRGELSCVSCLAPPLQVPLTAAL